MNRNLVVKKSNVMVVKKNRVARLIVCALLSLVLIFGLMPAPFGGAGANEENVAYAQGEHIMLSFVARAKINVTNIYDGYNSSRPFLASIDVPSGKAVITTDDLVVIDDDFCWVSGMYSASTFSSSSKTTSITLNTGVNHIYIIIRDYDQGQYYYYDVTVTRLASGVKSSDAHLFSVAGVPLKNAAGGTGASPSSPITANLTISGKDTIVTEDLVAAYGATATIYESDPPDYFQVDEAPLLFGENDVLISVRAENGSTYLHYKLTITRQASNSANLLTMAGQVIPESTTGGGSVANTAKASITVPNSKTSIVPGDLIVSPLATSQLMNAYFTSELPQRPLDVGENHVYVLVTADDTTTKHFYNITVTRLEPPSTDTSLISLAGQPINITGGAGTTANPKTAGITVPYSKALLVPTDIVAATNAFAYDLINANFNVNPPVDLFPLNVGVNDVYIYVRAEDRTIYGYYHITVTRQASGDNGNGNGGNGGNGNGNGSDSNGGNNGGGNDNDVKGYGDSAQNANVTAIRSPLKTLYLKKGKAFTPPVDFDGKDASGKTWGYKGYGTAPKLTWKSNKTSVATVNPATGKITAKKVGTAKVTATSLNGKAKITFTVKVVKKALKLKKLTLTKPPKSLAVGKTKILKVKLTSAKATGIKVTFKSSKPSVLQVDKAGKLFALKPGTAKITVKAGGKSKVITVKVK